MVCEFDVVIAGAGLAGCSLALALQQQGLKIALLEKHLPDFSDEQDNSFRPISLSHASVEICKTLGLWSSLSRLAAPIRQVRVSQQYAFGGLSFDAKDYHLDALGQVVPFKALHRALYQAISQQTGVSIVPINVIDSAEPNLVVQTAQGIKTFVASLLVAADGAQSTVRQLLNIPVTTRQKDEMALIARLDLASPHQSMAFERFCDQGILALLPLSAVNSYGFVWTMPSTKASEVKQWDDITLQQFISQQFGRRLPAIKSLDRGILWPLRTVIADQQIAEKSVLLGNAAHTIYPLAAQGFNLALRDVAALAEILVQALMSGQALGSQATLKKYCDWRLQEQKKIITLTSNIAGAATLKLPLASCMRGLGLLAVDLFPPLKRRIAELTLGLSGKSPKLVRGLPLW